MGDVVIDTTVLVGYLDAHDVQHARASALRGRFRLEGVERVAMLEFNGIDIILQHRLDDDRVHRALAAVLRVPEGRVALIKDVSHYPEAGDADVVCVSSSVEGEFVQLCPFKSVASLCLKIRIPN